MCLLVLWISRNKLWYKCIFETSFFGSAGLFIWLLNRQILLFDKFLMHFLKNVCDCSYLYTQYYSLIVDMYSAHSPWYKSSLRNLASNVPPTIIHAENVNPKLSFRILLWATGFQDFLNIRIISCLFVLSHGEQYSVSSQ